MSKDSVKQSHSTTVATATVNAQLQPSQARLGDLFSLTVKVTPPGDQLVLFPPTPKNWGTFEVYSSTVTAVPGTNAMQLKTELQNFTTGQQTLSGVEFSLSDLKGRSRHVTVSSMTVTIQEVPPGPKDKGDIRGIKGVLGPVAWSIWWWVLLAAIASAAGVWFWKKRQAKLHGPPPPPPEPADTVALRRLQELLATGWVENGRLKEFYIGLSDALRSYIENGFHCPALERTTSELLRDLRKQGKLESPVILQIKDLLESCDLVKFAKLRPDAAEALKDHASAVQIVEKTRKSLRGLEQ